MAKKEFNFKTITALYYKPIQLKLKPPSALFLLLFILSNVYISCLSQINNSHKENWSVCFPDGKLKTLILSYDDGLEQDKQVIQIFDKYGIKGTFNINSGKLGLTEGWLEQRTGKKAVFIKPDEIKTVYKNHEIASHTVDHPDLTIKDEQTLLWEVNTDLHNIEKLTGCSVLSFAYPFGTFSRKVVDALSQTQLINARTINDTHSFAIPDTFLLWHPTCHHTEAYKYIADFKSKKDTLALFFIWGHSWEFDYSIEYNSWEYFEKLCKDLSGNNEVWYAGAGEFSEYIIASRMLKEEKGQIFNPSSIPVFIKYNNKVISIDSKGSLKLRKKSR